MPVFVRRGFEEGEWDAVFWDRLHSEEGAIPLIDEAMQVLVAHFHSLEVRKVMDAPIGLDDCTSRLSLARPVYPFCVPSRL